MKTVWLSIGLMCLSLSTVAAQQVDKTVEAARDGYVQIEHLNGVAKVQGWERQEVRVVGRLGDKTDRFIFERDGNEVIIKVKVKRTHSFKGDGEDGDDLQIFVPNNNKVTYTSVNAQVKLSNLAGGVDVDTVNGEISAKVLAGRIRLESVNGNIWADKLVGDVKIETINGDIHSTSTGGQEDIYESVNGEIAVTSNSQEVSVETVNGDIKLNLTEVAHLNLNTVNGSIEVKLDLAEDAEVKASSVGGDVTLVFQENVSARFDIRSHTGGRIINDLSNDKMQKDKYGPGRWLEFVAHGGKGRVNVSTVSAKVSLLKD